MSVLSRVLRKSVFVSAWSAGPCELPFDCVLVDLKGEFTKLVHSELVFCVDNKFLFRHGNAENTGCEKV